MQQPQNYFLVFLLQVKCEALPINLLVTFPPTTALKMRRCCYCCIVWSNSNIWFFFTITTRLLHMPCLKPIAFPGIVCSKECTDGGGNTIEVNPWLTLSLFACNRSGHTKVRDKRASWPKQLKVIVRLASSLEGTPCSNRGNAQKVDFKCFYVEFCAHTNMKVYLTCGWKIKGQICMVRRSHRPVILNHSRWTMPGLYQI